MGWLLSRIEKSDFLIVLLNFWKRWCGKISTAIHLCNAVKGTRTI